MNKKPNRKKTDNKTYRNTQDTRKQNSGIRLNRQESIIRKQIYIELETGITGNNNKTNSQRTTVDINTLGN